MNYPLISEYIDAIKSAEDNFKELTHLRPVLNYDGQPVMTSGNFAVVFKMKDQRDGKLYAIKCFTKEQEGRAEAYRQITEELKDVDSSYLVSLRYLDKELFVDTEQTNETEFPVLLMDWVEGKTLDKYLRENLDDKYALEMLAYRFSQLAQWLIPQPFAHGDLKPDNILVREDGTLVLVDYDGMYVSAMKGQKARELGSPDFRHPQRTIDIFNEHIDDFPLLSILLSLKAISHYPRLLYLYGTKDGLLFSMRDYCNIHESEIFLFLINSIFDDEIGTLLSIMSLSCQKIIQFKLPSFNRPHFIFFTEENGISFSHILKKKNNNIDTCKKAITTEDIILLNELFLNNNIDYIITGTIALSICGLLPNNYKPHDIDVQIITNYKNHDKICRLFQQIENYCDKETIEYEDSDTRMFVFYIGNNGIPINAFIHHEIIEKSSYNNININNCVIKVHKALKVIEYKYAMKRIKDYKFQMDLQRTMESYLTTEL